MAPAGWSQTTTSVADITAASGRNVTNANVGQFQNITVSGRVFRDADGDGVMNGTDAGLQGRTVFLDTNGNNSLDAGEINVLTDSNGDFTFANLRPEHGFAPSGRRAFGPFNQRGAWSC